MAGSSLESRRTCGDKRAGVGTCSGEPKFALSEFPGLSTHVSFRPWFQDCHGPQERPEVWTPLPERLGLLVEDGHCFSIRGGGLFLCSPNKGVFVLGAPVCVRSVTLLASISILVYEFRCILRCWHHLRE